jgi:hypothetical protein
MSPEPPTDRDPKVAAARERVGSTDFSDPAEARLAAEALLEAVEALDDLVAEPFRLG